MNVFTKQGAGEHQDKALYEVTATVEQAMQVHKTKTICMYNTIPLMYD